MEKQYHYKRILILPCIWGATLLLHALIYDLLPGYPEAWLRVDDLEGTISHQSSATQLLFRALNGDIAESLFFHKPIFSLVLSHLLVSLKLVAVAFPLTYLLGITQGIGLHLKLRFSKIIHCFFIGVGSLPSFLLFSFVLVMRYSTDFDLTYHQKLMAVVFLFSRRIAPLSRLSQTCIAAESQEPYIAASYQRGVSLWRIWAFYLLRNALMPIWIKAPKQFCHMLFHASIVVEMLFSIKGYGYLSFMAIKYLDYPLILACLITASMMTSLSYLLGEQLQYWLNPKLSPPSYD